MRKRATAMVTFSPESKNGQKVKGIMVSCRFEIQKYGEGININHLSNKSDTMDCEFRSETQKHTTLPKWLNCGKRTTSCR